jgi:tetratricopeptide (TPR) repeat protein
MCAESGTTDGWAGSMLSLAWVHRQRGASADEVREEFEAALGRARLTGDSQIEAAAHRELGFLAWDRLHDEALARDHYEAARDISKRRGETKELGAVHAVLGYLEVEWGNVETAADHSWEAIRIATRIGDSHMLATAYDHLGLAWEARGELDSAAQWYERASQKEQQIDNPSGRVITALHLAGVYRKQGLTTEAAEALTLAQRLVQMYGLVDLQLRVDAVKGALVEGSISEPSSEPGQEI